MVDDSEVSPYLTEELRICDRRELRSPVGGYFNWRREDSGTLLLVAGGSEVVPLELVTRVRSEHQALARARELASAVLEGQRTETVAIAARVSGR